MEKVINNISSFFSRMSKKTRITILVVTLLILGVTVLYQTFATSSTISGDITNGYTIILDNRDTVSIPASGSKTVYFKVKNINNASVKYGVGYAGSNIIVKEYSDSDNPSIGTISKEESKFVKLYISNSGTSVGTVTLTTILGYDNGGDLIVPSGYTLVTSIYTPPVSLANYITKLYTNANKTTITNNSITYNYATSLGLMNDRLGSMSTGIDAGNIRYYGASPNNYIYFNCDDYSNQTSSTCEIWRIIGVFDEKVKIMRNESIGEYSWDNKGTSSGAESAYGKNNWSDARLMKMLNAGYESATGGSLYWNRQSGTCYSGQNNATKTCDMSSLGLKNETTRNMILQTTYLLLGWNSDRVYSDQIYNYERTTGSIYNETTRAKSWTGKIALAYPSDYGYAVDLNLCQKTLFYYDDSTCTSNNWMKSILKTSSYGWLLTPQSDSSTGNWSVFGDGAVHYNYGSDYESDVRPVLFLDFELGIKAGDGSNSAPYQLSVEGSSSSESGGSSSSDGYTVKVNKDGDLLGNYTVTSSPFTVDFTSPTSSLSVSCTNNQTGVISSLGSGSYRLTITNVTSSTVCDIEYG